MYFDAYRLESALHPRPERPMDGKGGEPNRHVLNSMQGQTTHSRPLPKVLASKSDMAASLSESSVFPVSSAP